MARTSNLKMKKATRRGTLKHFKRPNVGNKGKNKENIFYVGMWYTRITEIRCDDKCSNWRRFNMKITIRKSAFTMWVLQG